MNPVLAAQLRKQWPLVAAAVIFLLFIPIHLLAFQPALHRYQAALQRAAETGMPLDPERAPHMMPARVFALLSDNSLPADVADRQSNSGELASNLIDDLSRTASKHGMDVIATEPGATTRMTRAVLVRAHIRVSCSYGAFVAFLDDLSRSGRLISVDRFSLLPVSSGGRMLDMWVTRYVLKQTGDRH